MIQCYIDHRREVIRRRTEHLLREARKQAHRLEGLIYAVCDIDAVIKLIRGSTSREEAIEKLIARRFRIARNHPYASKIPARLIEMSNLGEGAVLTRVQAEAIGGLRLIQLVGLEVEKLTGEYTGLLTEMDRFEAILADEQEIYKIIRADSKEMRARFGDERRTAIERSEAEDFEIGDLIAEHTVVVTISHEGYVKRLPVETYREQHRGGRGIKGSEAKEGDFIRQLFVASTHDDLMCFTNTGRVFKMKVFKIPEMGRTARGRAIVNLLELRAGEQVVAFQPIEDFERSEDYLLFATALGRVKRTSLKDYRNVHRSGIIAINLNEGDRLIDVVLTRGGDDVLELPARIGGYAVVRVIGEGGMGIVYEAEQEEPRRRAAMKVIRPGMVTPGLLRRFRHEAQVLGQLEHPGIARIYEAGTEDRGEGGQAFFAMELIDGRPLLEEASAQSLGTRDRLELIARVCDALHHAHHKGNDPSRPQAGQHPHRPHRAAQGPRLRRGPGHGRGLRDVERLEEEYRRVRESLPLTITDEQRKQILALAKSNGLSFTSASIWSCVSSSGWSLPHSSSRLV